MSPFCAAADPAETTARCTHRGEGHSCSRKQQGFAADEAADAPSAPGKRPTTPGYAIGAIGDASSEAELSGSGCGRGQQGSG